MDGGPRPDEIREGLVIPRDFSNNIRLACESNRISTIRGDSIGAVRPRESVPEILGIVFDQQRKVFWRAKRSWLQAGLKHA
jgi:hypothetical protein